MKRNHGKMRRREALKIETYSQALKIAVRHGRKWGCVDRADQEDAACDAQLDTARRKLAELEAPENVRGRRAFAREYRDRQAKAELDSAAWFYHDKTPFETKYASDCAGDGDDGGEPAWLSDQGLGIDRLLDDVDGAFDAQRRRVQNAIFVVWRNARHCLATLRLVLVHGNDRSKSIRALLGNLPPTPANRELARQKYIRDLAELTRLFEARNRGNPGHAKKNSFCLKPPLSIGEEA